MGAKASKPAQAVSRKFPTRSPGGAVPPRAQAEAHAGRATPRTTKDEAIRADGRDPDLDLDPSMNPAYSERLRKMGVATPFPTLSNSSTAGPYSTPSPSPSTYTQISSSLSPPSIQQQQQQQQRRTPTNPSTKQTQTQGTTTTTTTTYSYPPQNRTLNALEIRRQLQARADAEFENLSGGREFLDAGTVRRALALLHRGTAARDIEAALKLKPGVVARLGPPGVAVPVETAGMNKQTWGGLSE